MSVTQPLRYPLQPDWRSPLNRGLVAWWPHIRSGVTLRDIAGDNHGTLVNLSSDWVAGPNRLHQSLDYSTGTGDYVNLGARNSFNFGLGDFAISAWLRTNVTTGYQIAVGKDVSGSREWTVGHSATSSGKWQFYSSVGGEALTSVTSVDSQWHMLTITRRLEGGSRIGRLFLDGKLEYTDSTFGHDYTNTNAVHLGQREFSGFPQPWNGNISDVRIWKGVAPTAAAVHGLYRASKQGYPNELLRRRRIYKAPAAVGGTTPHGPLGLPLHGPFAGPFG